jgi:alkyl hydroperoxide reductase subunit D
MFGVTANTKNSLFEIVNLSAELESALIDKLNESDSRYLKDLKINLSNSLKAASLTEKEAYLLAYSAAVNEKSEVLIKALEEKALAVGADQKEINEVVSCVSLMNANNVFYRFKHFLHAKEFYQNAQAGIRMSIMMNPVLGKEFFELLSLAISALNGCEMCVTSHEASVKSHGGSEQRIFDAVRLVAVVKSLTVIL